MQEIKSMTFLLLEDDVAVCNDFENLSKKRDDIELVFKTNSSREAIKQVRKLEPEAIIVDLELHKGEGSGFEFLSELRNTELSFIPLVIVTTKVQPGLVYDGIHEGYTDLVFYKEQTGYCIEYVINSMLMSRKKNNPSQQSNNSTPSSLRMEENKRISNLINKELDLVGINPKLNGRQYLFEAIFFMLEKMPRTPRELSPLSHIAEKYDMYGSNVSRDISTAIRKAWLEVPIEDLEENYTAVVKADTGEPSPLEFIFYYYTKIKNLI